MDLNRVQGITYCKCYVLMWPNCKKYPLFGHMIYLSIFIVDKQTWLVESRILITVVNWNELFLAILNHPLVPWTKLSMRRRTHFKQRSSIDDNTFYSNTLDHEKWPRTSIWMSSWVFGQFLLSIGCKYRIVFSFFDKIKTKTL